MKSSFILGFVFILVSSSTEANFVTYTAATSPTNRTTDFSQTLSIAAFNQSLGKLTSVTINFTDAAKINGTLSNNSAKAQNFVVSEDLKFSLSAGSVASANPILTHDLLASQSYTGLASNGTGIFGEFNPTGSAGPYVITQNASLATFMNDQPMLYTFSTLTVTTVSGGGGNGTTAITTLAGATLTVRYDFTPAVSSVPEPASMVMTLVGGLMVGSIGFAANRRKNRS